MKSTRTGFCRNLRGWGAETQRKILVESGVPNDRIYIDGVNGAGLGTALSAIRPGEVLELAGGLRALATGRADIVAELDIVIAAGKVVIDTQTGLRSDRDGAKMVHLALAKVNSEKQAKGPINASVNGTKGAHIRAENEKEKRAPISQATKVWMKKDGRTNAEKLADPGMRGWTQGTVYRHIGKSDRPCGNPGNHKND